MTKHTPGKWKIESHSPSVWGNKLGEMIYIKGQKDQLSIASITHRIDEEANARLIAAAPELLEACKLALIKCPFPVGAVKAKEALENAITKAEAK